MTTRPIDRLVVDDLTTERSFDSQDLWVIVVLGLFVDMLSLGICTTRH